MVLAKWVGDPLMMDVEWWLVVVSETVQCYELVQYHFDSKWLLRGISKVSFFFIFTILGSSLQSIPL